MENSRTTEMIIISVKTCLGKLVFSFSKYNLGLRFVYYEKYCFGATAKQRQYSGTYASIARRLHRLTQIVKLLTGIRVDSWFIHSSTGRFNDVCNKRSYETRNTCSFKCYGDPRRYSSAAEVSLSKKRVTFSPQYCIFKIETPSISFITVSIYSRVPY